MREKRKLKIKINKRQENLLININVFTIMKKN